MKLKNRKARWIISFIGVMLILVGDSYSGDRIYDHYSHASGMRTELNGTTGDSNQVELVGLWPDGKAVCVEARRDLCYFGHGGIFEIADFSDPANPVSLAKIDFMADIKDICLDSSFAYVADNRDGLFIIEISDSLNPEIAGSYDTGCQALDVVVRRDLAFVADGCDGLRIINVSDRSNPYEIGYYNTPATANGVDVQGDYAYVADSYLGLQVINIADSTAPFLVKTLGTHYVAEKVIVHDTLVYVADYGVFTFNISDPVNTVQLDYIGAGNNPVFDMALQGNYLYTANRFNGLRIYSLTVPNDPTSIEVLDSPGNAYGVAVNDTVCYLADCDKGILSINVKDVYDTDFLGSYDTASESRAVQCYDHYAFVANYKDGLKILDISDPQNPGEISCCDTPDEAYDLEINYPYVYIADYDSGLQVIDISDINNPQRVGSWGPLNDSRSIGYSDSTVYLLDVSNGLTIIDVRNPEDPQFLSVYDQEGNDVFIEGDYAFIAGGTSGLVILDISNPAVPVERGVLDTPGSCYGVHVKNEIAYIADAGGGLRLIDVSNPDAPADINDISANYGAVDVTINNAYAYVANNADGLHIFDISDPLNLSDVGYYDTGGLSSRVWYHRGLVYITEVWNGMLIFNFQTTLTDIENVNSTDNYYFNESGDGHQVDMNFTGLSGQGEVTVEQRAQGPTHPIYGDYMDMTWNFTHVAAIASFTSLCTFHYTDDDLSGLNEDNLRVFRWNGTAWQSMGGIVNAGSNEITVELTEFSDFALFSVNQVLLSIKVFLEGPYSASGDSMSTDLKAGGYVPLLSPYDDDRSVTSVPDNIVDWIFLELRSTATGDATTSRSFFLRKDGMITDDDGATTELSLAGADDGSYFIVVRHRNHLAVMSATAQPLNGSSALSYDFTDNSNKVYGGTNGAAELETDVWGMITGDANNNEEVQADDKETIWRVYVGLSGYRPSDFNLNGEVQADDKEIYWRANAGKGSQVP